MRDTKVRSQHFPQLSFIDDVYAELFCLVEFAAGFGTGEKVIGFFAYAAGDVTAERFDFFTRFFARHRGRRPGQNKSFSGQRQRGCFFCRDFFALRLDAECF